MKPRIVGDQAREIGLNHRFDFLGRCLSQRSQCIDDVSDRRRHSDLVIFLQPSQRAGVVGFRQQQMIRHGFGDRLDVLRVGFLSSPSALARRRQWVLPSSACS